ncbi:ABC transporter ATP-binding protein [Thermoproteus tenax]|uniref:Cobalt ABC transporter, ATP-binding protein n=1 Tax=Thermoproteus tenax (strain ATCC 35583 / DSM 2078 / JCM 9277 / NBRC 100435 / Kra 1) TaxID=768679 RepID=G4RMA9_THETK|nr:ABC transporter ATP-binding protein [Thermoproteus tenax]CCC80740.1 cobalt ABC transporter, ATP-binding protein [Thermoproteus tenax Kra 1]
MKVIEIENLFVKYLDPPRLALKGISLSVEEGDFILLVGRTGSGKSTLINSINGVIPNVIKAEARGRISVFGKDPRESPVYKTALDVGTVYQVPESQIFALVVEDDVAFGLENRGMPPEEMRGRVREALELVGLWRKRDHPTFLLSGGEKQRLVIASILALKPKVLILDEPTSMLDAIGTEEVFQLLRKLNEEGMTIIVAEHKVEYLLPFVDRVVALENGVIALDEEPHRAVAKGLAKFGVEEPQVAALHRAAKPDDALCPITVEEFFEVDKDVKIEVISEREAPSGEAIVKANGVVFKYPGNEEPTLRGVDLEIPEGAVVSVVGPNGSGKSTLMYLLVGLYRPTAGSVEIAGRAPADLSGAERVRLVGYAFQDPDQMLMNVTVRAEIEMSLRLAGYRGRALKSVAEQVAKELGIGDLLERSPHKLSVGQRRLVSLAAVLAPSPRVLILDEPTRGLDRETAEVTMKYLMSIRRERRMTIIMVSHDMRQVGDYSELVYVMYGGRIAYKGSPEDVFAEAEKHREWGLSAPQVYWVTRRHGKRSASLKFVRAYV